MADPIQLPNSAPKDVAMAKVARTARQKFENRRKEGQRNDDLRQHLSSKEQERFSMNQDQSEPTARNSRQTKAVKGASEKKSAGTSDCSQGNVIDIRV